MPNFNDVLVGLQTPYKFSDGYEITFKLKFRTPTHQQMHNNCPESNILYDYSIFSKHEIDQATPLMSALVLGNGLTLFALNSLWTL